jgi:hypothetical protein
MHSAPSLTSIPSDRCGNLLVFVRDKPRRHLDDRDGAAEAAVHLAEFETDVAPADDHQMARQGVERHHRGVRQVRHLVEAGKRRQHGAAADIDEDARCDEPLAADLDRARRDKPGVAAVEGQVGSVFEGGGEPIARLGDNRVSPGLDPLHIDRHRPSEHDPVFGGAARRLRRISRSDQRLGRCAAGIDAGAADELALGDRHLHAGGGEPQRQRGSGLAGADDDRVVFRHRAGPPRLGRGEQVGSG